MGNERFRCYLKVIPPYSYLLDVTLTDQPRIRNTYEYACSIVDSCAIRTSGMNTVGLLWDNTGF